MYRRWSMLGLAILGLSLSGADWTRFRGSDGLGASSERGLPAKWSDKENVIWRTELPGPGTSSPVVLGDRIYLTSYSGYALSDDDPGDMERLMRHVVCIDRASGQLLWKKDFKPQLPESEYSGGNNTWHGYASSTPATDGQRLYVFFGRSGVYGLDLDGNELWHTDVGSRTHGWGSGNSVVVHGDLVYVNASIESETLFALNRQTGEVVWRVGGIRGSRNTPLLVKAPGGGLELVVSLPGRPEGKVKAFDPLTGDELWSCAGIPDEGYVCPSVVAHDGIVYAIGGRKNTALAVKAGGLGDVTETNILWRTGKGSNVASPVYHDGRLYWTHERQGVAYCLDAKTGQLVYEERLDPRPGIMYSSVTVADGKIYALSQHTGTYVLAAKPKFELLAHNRFADDDSRTNASLAVVDGQLLLRNDRYLYCLGTKK